MTLEEVLLVLGGHLGLLIHSLQKDGYPRHTRGSGWGERERTGSVGRIWRPGDPNPSSVFVHGEGSAFQREGPGDCLSYQGWRDKG